MISSSEFLPQSQNSILVDNRIKLLVLNFKLLLLSEFENALKSFFIEKNLSKFDPHVGETSCQIRACQILSLIDDMDNGRFKIDFKTRLSQITTIKDKIIEIINIIKFSKSSSDLFKKLASNKMTLAKFLNDNNCTLLLHKEEFFLFHAYILTHFRKVNGFGDMCVNHRKIYHDLKLSRALTAKFVHAYQVRLSEWSCDFVYNCLELIQDENLEKIMPLFKRKDHDGRSILPCLHMSEIILKYLQKIRKSIVVVVERRSKIAHLDKVVIPFEVVDGDYKYHKKIQNKPCFIVYGTMVYQDNDIVETHQEYINRFCQVGVIEVLLANMAAHPQYSGITPETLYDSFTTSQLDQSVADLKERYSKFLSLSIDVGCEKSNPELLFIRHINCNRPDFSHIS